MRALIQRVREARVTVGDRVTGAIGPGLLVLAAVAANDTEADREWLARKIVALRIFDDDAGAMNRSVVDVGGAILAADEGSTVDVLVGIGGTPEGVIAACAMKCLDGAIFGKLYPRNDEERQAALEAGYELDKVLGTDDLVSGSDVFFAATGVTDGELLRGVRYTPQRVLTQSLSMRSKSGAIRLIEGRHHAQRSNLIRAGV